MINDYFRKLHALQSWRIDDLLFAAYGARRRTRIVTLSVGAPSLVSERLSNESDPYRGRYKAMQAFASSLVRHERMGGAGP